MSISLSKPLDPKSTEIIERYHELIASDADPHEWAFSWRTELNRGGFRAVDLLMEHVVDPGRCIGCASCVTICPVDVFDYVDEKPVDTRENACVACVLCTEVCPVLRPQDNDLPTLVNFLPDAKDEGFGEYGYGMYVRATDPEILQKCQDGGIVSALLIHGLEQGEIKGAVVGDVYPDNKQIGRPKLAKNRDDVLNSSASRYTYSPNTLALQQAVTENIGPIAVVGVPCQVEGVRLQQNSSIRMAMPQWVKKNVSLVIGLFCSESFTHQSINKLGEMLEVDPKRIDNINIKGKVVVRLDDRNGEVRTVSLKKYRDFARPACLYCTDYGAENADIGCGGIGLDGWTFTVIRTQRGHEVFQKALAAGILETRPFEDDPRGMELMLRLASDKKKNRPLPAQMPSLDERIAMGSTCPKTFYTTGPGAPKVVEPATAAEPSVENKA
ncbi:MAG: Coenzyme F420 hydrogenase/dehydrogenase, beta subunit C-terminal domain [Spongiibacteraceae bacterium]